MQEIDKLEEIVGKFDYLLQEGAVLTKQNVKDIVNLTDSLNKIIDSFEVI